MATKRYLMPTRILNFNQPVIKHLVTAAGWKSVNPTKRVNLICRYVKDQVKFGFSRKDNLIASRVLRDGHGHCNTKGNLLMALLRASSIPCRIHAFSIDQVKRKGTRSIFFSELAPKYYLHSKVEAYLNTQWQDLDNYTLDEPLLNALQTQLTTSKKGGPGDAASINDFVIPQLDWPRSTNLNQPEGLRQDFGVFDSPDEVFAVHGPHFSGVRTMLYQPYLRYVINLYVAKLRNSQLET